METSAGPSAAALQELLDRAVLRNLIESYAAFADQGEPESLAGLFTPDGELIVALRPGDDATNVRHGRAEIASAIANLSRYWGTTHVIGNVLLTLSGDTATGSIGCVAHHFEGLEGQRRDRVLHIRYSDNYLRSEGSWRIARRQLAVIAVENRPLQID